MTRKPQNQGNYIQELPSTEQLRTWTSGSELSDQEYFRRSPKPTSEREHSSSPSCTVHNKAAEGKFEDKVRKRSRIPRPHLSLPSLGIISRSKAARSDGGVIGSVIASTGNIAGAAAPVPSTLQPDVDKPGFRLFHFVPPFLYTQ